MRVHNAAAHKNLQDYLAKKKPSKAQPAQPPASIPQIQPTITPTSRGGARGGARGKRGGRGRGGINRTRLITKEDEEKEENEQYKEEEYKEEEELDPHTVQLVKLQMQIDGLKKAKALGQ